MTTPEDDHEILARVMARAREAEARAAEKAARATAARHAVPATQAVALSGRAEGSAATVAEARARAKSAPSRPRPRAPGQAKVVWALPGLCGAARIQTSFGLLPIKALRRRDELRTHDGRYLRVEWLDRMHLDGEFLVDHPSARPVVIRTNALGRALPEGDILMSPRQKLSREKVPTEATTVEAGALRGHPGVFAMPSDGVSYFRFHCGEPVYVQVEGLWVLLAP